LNVDQYILQLGTHGHIKHTAAIDDRASISRDGLSGSGVRARGINNARGVGDVVASHKNTRTTSVTSGTGSGVRKGKLNVLGKYSGAYVAQSAKTLITNKDWPAKS
jgi:hypothetical protein